MTETTQTPSSTAERELVLEIYNVWTLTEVDGKTVLELGGGPLASSPEGLPQDG